MLNQKSKNINLLSGNITNTLAKLSLPVMATAFAELTYNLVDVIWISKLGSSAVVGVGTIGMLIWFSEGILCPARIGGQVLTAREIGASNETLAKKYVKASLQLALFSALFIIFVYSFFANNILSFFKLPNIESWNAAKNYLYIVLLGIPFTFLARTLTALSTSMGNSKLPFQMNVLGILMNCVLDPVFIFGLNLGVKGAALATISSQFLVAIGLILKLYHEPLFQGAFTKQTIYLQQIKDCLKIGFGPALQTMGFSMISMIIARMIAGFGEAAIAAQKIGAQIESLSWMTTESFATALTSFISQNYGAGLFQRTKKSYQISLKLVLILGFTNLFLLYLFPEPIFSIFTSEAHVLAEGTSYLKILALSQPLMCVEIITASAFAGFGETKLPSFIILSFTALRIPFAYLLTSPMLGIGVTGIWLTISISTMLKGAVLMILFHKFSKRVVF